MPKSFSTKNLQILEQPTGRRSGVGVFEFTDDYSIFHFGKFPDKIPGKGEASCRIAAFNFDLLAKAGVRTHYRGFRPPNHLEFTLLRRLDPQVRPLGPADVNHLIPLQVIFRNSIPEGSSVIRRLRLGRLTPGDIGLTEAPRPGTVLIRPVIEYTTKLEEIDRFIDRAGARAIGGLSAQQLDALEETTRLIDDVVTEHARSVGLVHADGKVEFGRDPDGELLLVDHAGTPDEARFTLDGTHVSKQVLRDYYASTGIQGQVEEWVRTGRPRATWPAPDPLPAEVVRLTGEMYRSLCEVWTGSRIWGAEDLDVVLQRLRSAVPAPRRGAGEFVRKR
jgi:phosphoribosylaminoimidazole-succinocarboxamide synthase